MRPDSNDVTVVSGVLLCTQEANGGTQVNGVCVLPAAALGVDYEGFLVAGTPTEQGTFAFTVTVDGEGQPPEQAYSLTVGPASPLTIVLASGGSTLPPAMAGGAYDQDFGFSGGLPPYTWSVASGSLPPGLAFTSPYAAAGDNDSQLSGTPATAGTYTFTMRVTDSEGDQAPAQGGALPYTWSLITSNELPPGFTLDTTASDFNNILTGTPAEAILNATVTA
jgi:Putative Ig domain